MNKTKLKAWINIISSVVLLLSILSGLIVYRVFPRGRLSFLGISRHKWTEFHYSSALLFIFLIFIHLALHWDYIKNLPKIIKN